MLNAAALISYFRVCGEQEATLDDIELEKQVLKSLIAELSGDGQRKSDDMVEVAFDAAL